MDIDAKTIEQLGQRVQDARVYLHVDEKAAALEKLEAFAAASNR